MSGGLAAVYIGACWCLLVPVCACGCLWVPVGVFPGVHLGGLRCQVSPGFGPLTRFCLLSFVLFSFGDCQFPLSLKSGIALFPFSFYPTEIGGMVMLPLSMNTAGVSQCGGHCLIGQGEMQQRRIA